MNKSLKKLKAVKARLVDILVEYLGQIMQNYAPACQNYFKFRALPQKLRI